ncbi:hypothetical protein [Kineococcus sp. SYSU DK001]|uniref:hypothetical protein n=1 Tax=Kineococcus sp. SYSU DK001 TaxID=3383122 RepID=UPI003D7ED187
MTDQRTRVAVSSILGAALITELVDPGRISAAAVGLLAAALLPWAASFLHSAELPGGWRFTLRQVVTRQEDQAGQLEVMTFLITHFIDPYEREHLRKLNDAVPFPFDDGETRTVFEAELRRLLGAGLIERLPGKGIRTMGPTGDLRETFRITSEGRRYLNLLDDLGSPRPGDPGSG